ncbi:MAG: hypothetical protein ACRD3M_18690, partial [Thermoanaerobaculia bacterium]
PEGALFLAFACCMLTLYPTCFILSTWSGIAPAGRLEMNLPQIEWLPAKILADGSLYILYHLTENTLEHALHQAQHLYGGEAAAYNVRTGDMAP